MKLGRVGAGALVVWAVNVVAMATLAIGLWADGLWAPAMTLTIGALNMVVLGGFLFIVGYRRGLAEGIGPVKVVVVDSAPRFASHTANGHQPRVDR